MKLRILCTLTTALFLCALGCGQQSYEARLERTITRMRYQQRLDQFLNPPTKGAFEEMHIYLRSPKPMQLSPNFGLTDEPGRFDLAATFLAIPPAPAATADEAAPAPDPNAVLRLHVLARVKQPKKAKKKGEPPAPQPATPRGDFITDVRTLLAADTGAGEGVNQAPKPDKKGSNDFKRIVFNAANGNSIMVYFYKQGEFDVALVWDVPVAMSKSSLTGRELCLGSFSVGRKADANFAGPIDDDGTGSPPAPGAAGGAGGGGPTTAF